MSPHQCEYEPCGRPFLARRFDQKYCSVWHRRAAWLAQRADSGALSGSGRFGGGSGPDLAAGLFEASQTAHRPPVYAAAGLERLRQELSHA